MNPRGTSGAKPGGEGVEAGFARQGWGQTRGGGLRRPRLGRILVPLGLGLGLGFGGGLGARVEAVWPTPNPAFLQGGALEDFLQPTASGVLESALFGCVRNDGDRFHEGIDLSPTGRDRRGEATDEVKAVMGGVVAYLNRVAGHSSYGRYVVLEHMGERPAVYTLYAHLASISPALKEGEPVRMGQVLGVMGRSAGGYSIPRERAHLHFEIGLRLSDHFDAWYEAQSHRSPNRHGNHNGINLLGMDPLSFFAAVGHSGPGLKSVADWIDRIPEAFRVQIVTPRIPDFVRRYPDRLSGALPEGHPDGWEIAFSAWGVPLRLTPMVLSGAQAEAPAEGTCRLVWYDAAVFAPFACRDALIMGTRGQQARLGRGTMQVLEILFGLPKLVQR